MIGDCLTKIDMLDWREERFIHRIKYAEYLPERDLVNLKELWEQIN